MGSLAIFYGNKERFLNTLLSPAESPPGNTKTKNRSLFRKKYKSNIYLVTFQNSCFDVYDYNNLLSL